VLGNTRSTSNSIASTNCRVRCRSVTPAPAGRSCQTTTRRGVAGSRAKCTASTRPGMAPAARYCLHRRRPQRHLRRRNRLHPLPRRVVVWQERPAGAGVTLRQRTRQFVEAIEFDVERVFPNTARNVLAHQHDGRGHHADDGKQDGAEQALADGDAQCDRSRNERTLSVAASAPRRGRKSGLCRATARTPWPAQITTTLTQLRTIRIYICNRAGYNHITF
jgi:hypothetical protein